MSTKKALKAIKAQLEEGNHEAALYQATNLLKSVDKDAPEVAQILVFRGLALTHAQKWDEAEKSYLQAYRIDPFNPLAGHGLRKLYEKQEAWDKLCRFLGIQVQASFDSRDPDKTATALQELLALRQTHGPQEKVLEILILLVSDGPLVSLLQSATPPSGTYVPFPTPLYPPPSLSVQPTLPRELPHILHLVGSLPLALNLLIRAKSIVHTIIEQKVEAGRKRLGAGSPSEVRRNVEAEILGGSEGMAMVDLLEEVARHPNTDEEVRRDVEVEQFIFWRNLAASTKSEGKPTTAQNAAPTTLRVSNVETASTFNLPEPSLFVRHTPPTVSKGEAVQKASALAEGFVLLNVTTPGAEEAWSWVIEGTDQKDIFYDLEDLHKFVLAFPSTPLSDFTEDYCRWFHLPLPDADDEGDENPSSEALKDHSSIKKRKASRPGKTKGPNARDRRKARRLAEKEGTLAEDVDQEEKEELIAEMTKLLRKLPKSVFAHRVMTRVSIQEEDWQNAVTYAEKSRILLKELESERGTTMPLTRLSIDTALGIALVPYYPPKHHARANRLLSDVLSQQMNNLEARFARARILQTEGRWAEAREEFQIMLDSGPEEREAVAAREEIGWCLVNEDKLSEGRDVLEEVVQLRETRKEQDSNDDEAYARARGWYRLGRCEWLIGDEENRQHAEEWFMASCRALPSYAPAYTSLGICYESNIPPDEDRALKCFQKAFELDATEVEAARRLVIGYADDDEWALVRGIAMRVMEGEGGVEGIAGGDVLNAKGRFAPKNGWAWKALGSTEMHYKKYAEATQAFQIALRAEPSDVSTWILLGTAYLKLGRHMAALKALSHALELDPKAWVAQYNIGETYHQLGAFDKAIEAYQSVLHLKPPSQIGVIASVAQSTLSLGRQASAGGFRQRARNAFHDTVTLAADVLRSKQGHRPWAWKTIGDAAFQLASLETTNKDAQTSATVLKPILKLLVEDDTDRHASVTGLGHASSILEGPPDLTFVIKTSIFVYAYRAWLLSTDLRVSNLAIYDLASALHALAISLPVPSSQTISPEEEKSEGSTDLRTCCLKAAIVIVRKALEHDASDERLWNALGVISSSAGPALAQHAFIISLELYSKDPIVWTNLGYLYLNLDDLNLASECFLKAQILDPDYAQAWYGQGIIAYRSSHQTHATELFAHSVTLSGGSLLEADLAHALTIFLPFLDPSSSTSKSTSTLHQPLFALRSYIHNRPKDPMALNLYALMCERIGLSSESIDALVSSAQLLEEEYESTESPQTEHLYIVVLCNLARVRLSTGNYTEALEGFKNCLELIDGKNGDEESDMRVQCLLGQGISEFWLDKVDQSLESFEKCLEICQGKEKREEVIVLLARTLWGMGEDGKEVAKDHLMDW
ncbi:hypothetical protein M231_01120 [Tremella mesenterica]|uniref:Superkiller protein 3 n=1 Tax=Tremella mesenterica TaxID=5217 RepID=A0A4Q1BU49_TREME|nr:hypothetical protein M231_01120 [Tremella mesenterica]